MKFLPLLTLQLLHSFYSDGRCPDFAIKPTPATQRQLRNYRCTLKPFANGVRVLIAVSEDGAPYIPLPNSLLFDFQLRLQNPDFALFTELTEFEQLLAPLYTNAGLSQDAAGQLALVSQTAQATEHFVVREPKEKVQLVLGGQPLAGLQPGDFAVEGLGSVKTVSHFDAAAKVITVNSSAVRKGAAYTVTYAIAPQQERGVFAGVEIHYDGAMPAVADGPQSYNINFNARSPHWSYYLVAERPEAQFRIEEKGASSLIFSNENRTDLNQHPDPSDEIAKTLAEQYPHLQRWRFVSDDLVPCRQKARKQIQLHLNGNQVMSALPNPSLRNYTTVEVRKNGSRQKEESLFQVIKFFVQ